VFVDREEEELSLLQKLYVSGRSQLVLIYGRRRVGKT
jgi:AAA+ ATPase superfamily predicted ATPase